MSYRTEPMPHSNHHGISGSHGSARKGFRTMTIVLSLVCIGILIAVLAPTVLLFFGFHQAMSSFGPAHVPSQAAPIVPLIGLIVICALPLAIFLLRRAFSNRHK